MLQSVAGLFARRYVVACSQLCGFRPTEQSNRQRNMPTTYSGILLDQGGAVFNVQNPTYGATGNGTTDDTTAIQAAITAAQAAPGGGVVWFPPGTYAIKSNGNPSLTVTGANVTLMGAKGAVISQLGTVTGPYDPITLQITAAGVTVRDLTFQGQGRGDGTGNNGTLVRFQTGADRGRVINCVFRHPGAAAIDLYFVQECVLVGNDINCASDETGTSRPPNSMGMWTRSGTAAPTRHSIVGNTIRYAANEGIIAADSQGSTIADNVIRSCSYAGITIYTSTIECRGNVIQGNTIDTIDGGAPIGGIAIVQPSGGVSPNRARYNVVQGNTVRNVTNGTGITLANQSFQQYPAPSGSANVASATSTTLVASGSPGWTVNGFVGMLVTITSGTGSGQIRPIYSNTANTLSITGSDGEQWTTIPDATSKFQILDSAIGDNVVTGNVVTGSGQRAIMVGGARSRVIGNIAIGSGAAYNGIDAGDPLGIGSLIQGNVVLTAGAHGIYAAGAQQVVAENYAAGCGGWGILGNATPQSGSRYRGNAFGGSNASGDLFPPLEAMFGNAVVGSNDAYFGFNLYNDGAGNWRYRQTGIVGYVIRLNRLTSQLVFSVAPAGTAGATAALTDCVAVDGGGNVFSISSTYLAGYGAATRSVSSNTTVLGTDSTIRVDASGAPHTVTLMSAAAVYNGGRGLIFTIKKIDSSLNAVTLAAAGTDKIDGVASKSVTTQYAVLRVQSNGSSWDIV